MKNLNIVFHSMGMPFDGETIKTVSLGGSETAIYYQARELADRGHQVVVFTSKPSTGFSVSDGVKYLSLGEVNQQTPLGRDFEHYARQTPHDVLIIQRHPLAFQQQFASKVNIWQLHDLALIRTAGPVNSMLWNVDRVTTVSEWHKAQVEKVWGIDPNFIDVVPNGVDPELYVGGDDVVKNLRNDNHFKMLYQSRPERGLEHLVRPGGIMDQLRDTNAHLLLCGYENTVPEMQQRYAQWYAWADALPNVKRLGALSKKDLAIVQKTCDLLVYPTEFEEVSCITAMEAMHAGLPMLTTNAGALPETCRNSGTIHIANSAGAVDELLFAAQIRDVYLTEIGEEMLEHLSKKQLRAAEEKSWAVAVDQLERTIQDCLAEAAPSTAAAVRHCIEHSDIELASWVIDDDLNSDAGLDAITFAAESEIESLYSFRQSPQAYQAHYAKHQTKYYDDHEEQVIGEDVSNSPRFRGTIGLIGSELTKPSAKAGMRILDYGCAHGHYLVPLAKEFPKHHFVGVDISARAIGAATKWCQRDNVTNVTLMIGGEEALEEELTLLNGKRRIAGIVFNNDKQDEVIETVSEPQLFDIILAGEVVEHVVDPVALLNKFRSILKPGGLLVITTPYGRWEWLGTEAFREAREHLVHFTRNDIAEICGLNKVDILTAPSGGDHTGRPLGSLIWGVRVAHPFVQLNQQRRFDELATRQTVSACLIIKDGERTIRKCLESFIDWVDEIIVAIDPKTKDRTAKILTDIQEDYPWRAITVKQGLSAIEYGFHAARNAAMEEAAGDWILWLDADEEIQQPQNLWKYLRPSEHRAIGFPQVHYACDPAQVLTTDFPCRLFRNNQGIKFYGFVHEHPEEKPGEAIKFATVRHDVQFLHSGYVDEPTRRRRFERNMPLLVKDMKAFPERKLNKFLWLRDIAQSIQFRVEQQQGYVTEAEQVQAREGIKCFVELVDNLDGSGRMVLDAVQYYSLCVSTLQEGFEAELNFVLAKPPFNDLTARAQVKGRFHSIELYTKLVDKLLKEGTKHYADKYL